MDVRKMDALSDWDDWSDDGPEWWLRHPLHRPKRKRGVALRSRAVTLLSQTAKKITLA
jgi:hypothetical protein